MEKKIRINVQNGTRVRATPSAKGSIKLALSTGTYDAVQTGDDIFADGYNWIPIIVSDVSGYIAREVIRVEDVEDPEPTHLSVDVMVWDDLKTLIQNESADLELLRQAVNQQFADIQSDFAATLQKMAEVEATNRN